MGPPGKLARNPLYFCARVFLLIGRDVRPFDSPLFHSQFFMSTRRPRNRTPSLSSRNRCSAAESPRNLISPPAPSTRCQGNPNPRCRMRATMRDRPGYPAALATPPYVNTFPCGISRITRSRSRRSSPESIVFFAGLMSQLAQGCPPQDDSVKTIVPPTPVQVGPPRSYLLPNPIWDGHGLNTAENSGW